VAPRKKRFICVYMFNSLVCFYSVAVFIGRPTASVTYRRPIQSGLARGYSDCYLYKIIITDHSFLPIKLIIYIVGIFFSEQLHLGMFCLSNLHICIFA